MSSSGAVGERIRMIRLASSTPQVDVAKSLGSDNNGLVSKIENGRIPVNDAQLRRIAERLDCAASLLQQPVPEAIATRPWLRAYSDAPARTVESVKADNLLVHEFVDGLRLQRVADTIPQFPSHANLDDDSAIEAFALEVRSAADIADGDPVRNAMRTAERLGCVVLPLQDELGRHLGLSQRIDGLPYIRASRARPNVPGDRQRFTVLHEVGHLALHTGLGPPETAADARMIEKQAHLFAAAVLIPADPLVEHWHQLGGRVTLTVLQELKAHWGVAVKALVGRFSQLGVIAPDQAVALYKQISKRGWNTGEPIPVSNEAPVWLHRALARRYARGESVLAGPRLGACDGGTVALAAKEYGLGASHVARWTDWSPSDREARDRGGADILPMESHQARRPTSTAPTGNANPATVTRLQPPQGI